MSDTRVVGQRTRRKDAPPKLTGQERFTGDLRVAGMLIARPVSSPYAHARIRSIDASAALKIPGVVRVLTVDDLPLLRDEFGSPVKAPIASGETVHVGHFVALVLAEDDAAAQDGVAAVEVDYEVLPVVATLDAALRCGACSEAELEAAVREQKGRRGIVKVRDLLPYADRRSESAMESEARSVFIDAALPPTEIQYEIWDHYGALWRVDFAWPEAMVAAEYDSMEWHANPTAWKRDRIKTSRLQECGWELIRFVVDNVRRNPADLVDRVRTRIDAARLPA